MRIFRPREGWESDAPNEMSSSCNVRSLDDSASASAMNEYGLPVAEKQSLSASTRAV